uniref:Uncharacterized protein n=1 Tax=Candidatus Kentrum sp. FM TaxID=2126340 RepID=A0A450VXB5_9GAMM|nr:MAG: hypothetical protein BECKFM1743A_GA0114220_100557 [Candidatus Kentron sp. FM]VFJ48759.1 MAG: hypothetical protein BECKFM1743C_GA0114222_100637 [Candidatus Kentron sp. FM]VFK09437.1 MAG: hypothetical protein BECKFM1743B_GA0114221_101056 [Candidatus Kentron sp. FM]
MRREQWGVTRERVKMARERWGMTREREKTIRERRRAGFPHRGIFFTRIPFPRFPTRKIRNKKDRRESPLFGFLGFFDRFVQDFPGR